MAQKSMTVLKVSSYNSDSEQSKSVDKGIISNGMVLDNTILNEKLKSTQNLLSKDPKRPSLPIYRPGMGLLHKHSPKANVSDEERAPDGEENSDKTNWISTVNGLDLSISDTTNLIKDINNLHLNKTASKMKNVDRESASSKKSKNKRPDQPKYIPKPKIAAQCPSPDPSECDEMKVNGTKTPLEIPHDEFQKNKSSVDSPCTSSSEKNTTINNTSTNQRIAQTRKYDEGTKSQNEPVGNRTCPPSNYTCLVISSNGMSKRSQDDINANTASKSNRSEKLNTQTSRNNESSNRSNVLGKSDLVSVNSMPCGAPKADSNDTPNRNSKGRRARKSKESKTQEVTGRGSKRNENRFSEAKNERDNRERAAARRGSFSRNVENARYTTSDHLIKSESYRENVSSGSSSPSFEVSLSASTSTPGQRENSPTKQTTNVPAFSSPKGRGRGRTPNPQSNNPDAKPQTLEIVLGKAASSNSLGSLDYDAEGPRPTLIFESSHKIIDWHQEVTNEEDLRNSAREKSEANNKRVFASKRPDYSASKETNRFNRQVSECSNNSDSSSSVSVSLRTERPTSEFQQNPPPRFQRNKDGSSLNKPGHASDDPPMFNSKSEKGILKVNWDNFGPMREPSISPAPVSMHYGRTPDTGQYKTLFDPSQPLNNHFLQNNAIPSYHQQMLPVPVPRNIIPGNAYPASVSPGMQNCRQYPIQPVPPHHNVNKQSHTTYPPYMMHQPPTVFGQIPPNSQIPPHNQIPPPPCGMFSQPFSEALSHPQENSNKRVKPIVEKNLYDIGLLERELNTYLAKGLDNVDLKALGRCRWKIQLRYENVILADPRFCADKNVENALWKSAFHQVIEAYRKLREVHPNKQEELNKAIINLVEEGTVFYESLLEKQQETFGINFSQYLDTEAVARPLPLDSVKIILISTQKIFICLGDLARYREQATNTSNYGKARSWYMKAQQIAPKNGRPYNQLAILAICARRKLDAVYYYMRSLAASNPFLSARESLLGLFDEARKKFEVVEKKKQDDKTCSDKSDKSKNKSWRSKNNDRIEVWIPPAGVQPSKSDESLTKENSQDEISTVELNKRFVLSFLHVHGKLFTKVGMENFTETSNQMLQEFKNLLQCTPAPLASVRLLQLLAINMFSVANSSTKGGPPMDSSERPLLQEQALQVSLAMMAIVIERSISLLKEHLVSEDYPAQLTSYDLAQLLPTVKIFTDWMSCQRNLWSPPPTLGDLRTGCKGDIWTLYANLLNELKKMKDCGIELKPTKIEGYEPVSLPEDTSLACFVPLLGAPQNPYYGQPPLDKERARTWLRITRILFFGDYLCGITPPYLKFDVQSTKYVSLITSHSEDNTESSGPNTTYNSSDEDDCIEDLPEDYLEDDVPKSPLEDTSEIGKLWHRQEALKRKKDREERRKAQIQQVLRDHRTKRTLEIQIKPKYLIPDTNCFIDHLKKIDLLLKSNSFSLIVPLMVINELDGLALGERPNAHFQERPHSSSGFYQSSSSSALNPNHSDHQQHRARQVGQAAKEAVIYLEESFASREFKLKAITSKGNLLDSISIRSEDIGEKKGTNDDMILSCCLHYCDNDKAADYMPKDADGYIHITREVVLLTDDRNLRVKAMTHNVPTRSLDEFLRWARIR